MQKKYFNDAFIGNKDVYIAMLITNIINITQKTLTS